MLPPAKITALCLLLCLPFAAGSGCLGAANEDATPDEILHRAIFLTQRGAPRTKLPEEADVGKTPHRRTQPNRNTLAQTIICEFGPRGMEKVREALTKPRVNTAVLSMSVDAWGRFRGIQIRQTFVCHALPYPGEVPTENKIWQYRIRPAIVDIEDVTRDNMNSSRIRVRTVQSAFEDQEPHSFGQCIGGERGLQELNVEHRGYNVTSHTHEESQIDLGERLQSISGENDPPDQIKKGLEAALSELDGAALRDPTYSVVRWDYKGNDIKPLSPDELIAKKLEDVALEDEDYFDQSVSRSVDGVVQFMDIDISVVARRFAGLGDENSSPEPPKITSNIEFVLAAAGAVGGAVLEEVLLGQALQRSPDEFEEKVMMSRWGPIVRIGSIFALVIVDLLPLVFVLSNELRVAAWRGDVALGAVGVSLYGPNVDGAPKMRGGGISVGMVSCLLWLSDARVELASTLLAVAMLMHFCVITISIYRKITRRQAEKKAELERQEQYRSHRNKVGLDQVPEEQGAIVRVQTLDRELGPEFDPADDMESVPQGTCAPIQDAALELGRHITLESPRSSRRRPKAFDPY